MELKAYICPQCGGSLLVESADAEFAVCPQCGSRIRITYSDQEKKQNQHLFVTPDGVAAGSACVPADYKLSASVINVWQSELVPLTAVVTAENDKGIILRSDSKELFHDVRNVFIRGIITLVPQHTENGYESFIEPDAYIRNYAEKAYGGPLTLTAKAKLPSAFGMHPETAMAQLRNDISMFDSFMEMPSTPVNVKCESVMYKFTGKTQDGYETVVFAGMDYEGAELVYGADLLKGINLDGITENVNKVIDSSETLTEFRSTVSDAISGKDKLTFSDMMRGGLIGKALRRKQEKQNNEQPAVKEVREEKKEGGPVPFGHSKENGRRVDQITFGSYRRYLCMALKEKEEEAEAVFRTFVSSFRPDPALGQMQNEMISRKMAEIRQTAAQNAALAVQKQRELQKMQMETSRMISRNSREASAGLMDSFQRKMDSDSRISAARSEAIRGVNVYENSYGQSVDVSTAADHVYQDSYGDVYGVSGNAVDQDVLNESGWTEITKNKG